MKQALLSWVGLADLKAADSSGDDGSGPVAQALAERKYDRIVLLANFNKHQRDTITAWLGKHTSAEIELRYVELKDPTDFDAIHKIAVSAFEYCISLERDVRITVHLSPGTPAMAAVWILLSKTRFDARLIQSSREQGVKLASVPFDISADYIPDLLNARDTRIEEQVAGKPIAAAGFEAITYRSPVMKRLIARAQKVAQHSVPVLIEGESGTGKELLAQAIHKASSRAKLPFVAVNCGAIPRELVESHLFGHKKGSFTGAVGDQTGLFMAAGAGTLFLDEVGELDAPTQVKLLRVLQEKVILPIGSDKPLKVIARVISATNRSLISEVQQGNFREDLFFRLAVATLYLPPLRLREGDLSLLIDTLMNSVQTEMLELATDKHKKISAKAKNILLSHNWPGNIRELQNTLARALLWSEGTSISEGDMQDAILTAAPKSGGNLMALPLGETFNLLEILNKVEKHYIKKAIDESHGHKTQAAELLGLKNYQNLSNRMKKHGLD